MVPNRNMESQSDTFALPRVLLAERFVKLVRVFRTDLTAHIHVTRFVNMS